MNWSSHLTQLSGKEKKIVNGSSIIVSLACSAGVLLGRVDVKRLANSTDYVWFGVRVDVGGRGRGKVNIQCPTPFPPLLCDRHISTTPSPLLLWYKFISWKDRGAAARIKHLVIIRSHGIDRGSNLKTLNCSRYSAVTIFLVEVGCSLLILFQLFFYPNFNFRPQPCFRGFEIMLSKSKFAFSQPYSLHHPSLHGSTSPSPLVTHICYLCKYLCEENTNFNVRA